jgi:uncharacterized repeat protein (TIGR03803 family)
VSARPWYRAQGGLNAILNAIVRSANTCYGQLEFLEGASMRALVWPVSTRHLYTRVIWLLILCVTQGVLASAQTFTTLHSFSGSDGDGASPTAAVILGTDGNFYGTTYTGGANSQGTVFKVTPGGALTTLYSFCAQSGCADGAQAASGLVQGSDGNFYGTTRIGGAHNDGTVFKMTPSGTLTTLYSFCEEGFPCYDGQTPEAGLVQGTDGNFYGTTYFGGAEGNGTVFKITPAGTLTTLYSFREGNGSGATLPQAGLVQGTDGNFYGTTYHGGTGYHPFGTVFKITPLFGTLTTLYNFCDQKGCPDGENPEAGLVQGTDGNFYGTTPTGGAYNDGTVFEMTPSGTLTTLYSFCSQNNCADGNRPVAGLIQASDGNFYGTTQNGGGAGTVFQITSAGTLTTLHSFAGSDGANPQAALVQAPDGSFYGTTEAGGANNYGTVFSLTLLASPTPPATPSALPTATPSPLPAPCVGDCRGTGSVLVTNIITLVNIVLGAAQSSACPDGIPSGAPINVTLIIQAVRNALASCPAM